MTRRFALGLFALALIGLNSYAEPDCSLPWKGTALEVPRDGSAFFGDTYVAYAEFRIPESSQLIYRLTGAFPRARYFSLETHENRDIGDWDFAALQDFEFVPDVGSVNPFLPEIEFSSTPRAYTVDVVPADGTWEGDSGGFTASNILEYPPTNGLSRDLILRVNLPSEPLQVSDLPTIVAYNPDGTLADCPDASPLAEGDAQVSEGDIDAIELVQTVNPELYDLLTEAEGGLDDIDLFELVLQLWVVLNPEKWWTFSFSVWDIPFEGNSGIPGYSGGGTEVTPGKVAVVRFKAPSFVDTSCPSEASDCFPFDDPDADMRYWSICSLDIIRGRGLACLPDYQFQPDEDGFVTVVFGPAGGLVERVAGWRPGHIFLPDNREAQGTDLTLPIAFVLRQLLPSESFAAADLHQGDYLPQARVCSARGYLFGWCRVD